jgi:glycosidase
VINDLWYKNAVIYCQSVATFLDANGDGVGDFAGLMRRLDYLQGLGVTAIWLMLVQRSPWRMDAVPSVIAKKGPAVGKPVEQYDMLRTFREFLHWREGEAIVLAEANVLPFTDMEYFGRDGDRMHMMFNFEANQTLFFALAAGDMRPLKMALKATKPRPPTAQWGMFLRNHDELDLAIAEASTRRRVQGIRTAQIDAALPAGHPPPTGADAGWRSTSHRASLQLDVHPSRNSGHALRRRDRNG